MSTGANIYVFHEKVCVGALQCHSDGYPAGVGKEIADLLSTRPLTNGISDYFDCVDGAENIIPMLIGQMQLSRIEMQKRVAKAINRPAPPQGRIPAGGLYSLSTKPLVYNEYNYHLTVTNYVDLTIKVLYGRSKVLFDGDINGFVKFCKEQS